MARPALANPPPRSELERARRYAREAGRSVYLFHDGRQWRLAADIRAVPMSGHTVEVHPGPDADTVNLGGC